MNSYPDATRRARRRMRGHTPEFGTIALATAIFTLLGFMPAFANAQSSAEQSARQQDLLIEALSRETCPSPQQQTVVATNYSVLASDMPKSWHPKNGLNGTQINTFYAHTFYWKPSGTCCQATRAVMTATFTALRAGQSANAGDAGNDEFFIFGPGGVIIPITGTGRIWANWPFAVGNTITRTVTITNPAVLSSGHVSLVIQDDTAITSASLQVFECCVNLCSRFDPPVPPVPPVPPEPSTPPPPQKKGGI